MKGTMDVTHWTFWKRACQFNYGSSRGEAGLFARRNRARQEHPQCTGISRLPASRRYAAPLHI